MRFLCLLICCIALFAPAAFADEPANIEQAAKGLQSADPQARVTAVLQLAKLARDGDHRAALAMGPALQDADQRVRDQVRQTFDNLPHDALVEATLAATHDANAETCRQAALVLSDLDFYQRRECAFIAPLLTALVDPDQSVREAAHWSLQQIHDRPTHLWSLQREFGQGLRPKGLEGGYPRGQMLASLGWPADADPVPQVMAGLTSPDPQVRRWSAWLAGWMDRPAAIPSLRKMLTDENPLVRLGAAEGLGHIFDPAVVRPLVAALPDADPGVRRQAVLSLGNARLCAVDYQRNNPDHYVDAATIDKAKALGTELAAAKAGEAVLSCLQDKEASVRMAAASVLPGFQKPLDVVPALLPLLQDADAGVVRAAVLACHALHDARAVSPLLEALQAHPDLDGVIINALGNIGGDQVITLLTDMLRKGDEQQRMTAASLLTQMRDPKLVDALLLALNDTSETVRFSTALNFSGAVKDPRLTDRFIVLLSDPSADVRQASGQALARLRDPRSVEALCKTLADPVAHVRMRAAQALGEIKDPKAVDPLIAALKSDNPQVRVDVLYALWNIGDRKAVPAAIGMLKDANATVRQEAVRTLVNLTRQNFGEDAAKWQAWWEGQAQ